MDGHQLSESKTFPSEGAGFNPCIVNESIYAPIVIVGFPRSGTTLLQNLLGLAPEGTFALAMGGFFSVPDY
jgi:hypothetical protein